MLGTDERFLPCRGKLAAGFVRQVTSRALSACSSAVRRRATVVVKVQPFGCSQKLAGTGNSQKDT